eukprot:Ihof_evm9s49 gene=Ihof_evmTU9s49
MDKPCYIDDFDSFDVNEDPKPCKELNGEGEGEDKKKRHRRTFAELSRNFICDQCKRPYATEHSLNQHIRLKHAPQRPSLLHRRRTMSAPFVSALSENQGPTHMPQYVPILLDSINQFPMRNPRAATTMPSQPLSIPQNHHHTMRSPCLVSSSQLNVSMSYRPQRSPKSPMHTTQPPRHRSEPYLTLPIPWTEDSLDFSQYLSRSSSNHLPLPPSRANGAMTSEPSDMTSQFPDNSDITNSDSLLFSEDMFAGLDREMAQIGMANFDRTANFNDQTQVKPHSKTYPDVVIDRMEGRDIGLHMPEPRGPRVKDNILLTQFGNLALSDNQTTNRLNCTLQSLGRFETSRTLNSNSISNITYGKDTITLSVPDQSSRNRSLYLNSHGKSPKHGLGEVEVPPDIDMKADLARPSNHFNVLESMGLSGGPYVLNNGSMPVPLVNTMGSLSAPALSLSDNSYGSLSNMGNAMDMGGLGLPGFPSSVDQCGLVSPLNPAIKEERHTNYASSSTK